MAVGGVLCEPFSVKFPANGEKYREIHEFPDARQFGCQTWIRISETLVDFLRSATAKSPTLEMNLVPAITQSQEGSGNPDTLVLSRYVGQLQDDSEQAFLVEASWIRANGFGFANHGLMAGKALGEGLEAPVCVYVVDDQRAVWP